MSARSRMTALPLLIACAQCVNPTAPRTERESTIGRVETASTAVVVADGLGAVRALSEGSITIWAGAPVIRVHIGNRGAARAVELHVRNVLADARLQLAPGSEPLAVSDGVSDIVTDKRWQLQLPGHGDVDVVVGPDDDARAAPFRFAVLSDVQEAIDRVQDIYRRMNDDPAIRFVISSGDLTRRGTPDELERFQRELRQLQVPFFSTTGNHELGTDEGFPFQDFFGRGNFRFVYRGAQFTFLDSGSATIDPQVYTWLDGWLAEGRARVNTVTMHIPPVDPIGVRNGSFADRGEAAKLLTKLAVGHVDLTLYGHVHSYYAFANAGIPAYISGGGGAIPERLDGIGRNYLTVDIDPARGIEQTGVVRIDSD